ncbi:ATP-binding protein [Rhodanobacter lindaniclasticus]
MRYAGRGSEWRHAAGGARWSRKANGPGVPPSLPRLSERFFRVGASAEPGSGLGLAIVQHIASRHRGGAGVRQRRAGTACWSVTSTATGDHGGVAMSERESSRRGPRRGARRAIRGGQDSCATIGPVPTLPRRSRTSCAGGRTVGTCLPNPLA